MNLPDSVEVTAKLDDDGQSMIIEISLPAEVTDSEALDLANQIIKAVDEKHISLGGSGVVVDPSDSELPIADISGRPDDGQ